MNNQIAPPKGAPSWVTPELIADTIEVWQPDCGYVLTPEDALEIIISFDQLVGTLEDLDDE